MTLNKVIIVLKFKVEGIEQFDEADIFLHCIYYCENSCCLFG